MKKRKKSKWSYWVFLSPGAYDGFIIRKPKDWEPPTPEFRGPFWRARYARQYGRNMAYGEVAKSRNKAFAFKKGDIQYD